jgi:hypothetical protein
MGLWAAGGEELEEEGDVEEVESAVFVEIDEAIWGGVAEDGEDGGVALDDAELVAGEGDLVGAFGSRVWGDDEEVCVGS